MSHACDSHTPLIDTAARDAYLSRQADLSGDDSEPSAAIGNPSGGDHTPSGESSPSREGVSAPAPPPSGGPGVSAPAPSPSASSVVQRPVGLGVTQFSAGGRTTVQTALGAAIDQANLLPSSGESQPVIFFSDSGPRGRAYLARVGENYRITGGKNADHPPHAGEVFSRAQIERSKEGSRTVLLKGKETTFSLDLDQDEPKPSMCSLVTGKCYHDGDINEAEKHHHPENEQYILVQYDKRMNVDPRSTATSAVPDVVSWEDLGQKNPTWTAFLFTREYKAFADVYSTADLWFRYINDGRDPRGWYLFMRRTKGKNTDPWVKIALNESIQEPNRMKTDGGRTVVILRPQNHAKSREPLNALHGAVIEPNGQELWFVAVPSPTKRSGPELASAGR
ncbi:MAG TPA: hypothetical protein VI895_12385 [Bdellovibrionota bacterium]|nr:hypothetical protein [Bdellovibrionota bacterium]